MKNQKSKQIHQTALWFGLTLIIGVSFLFFPGIAQAATCTWTGANDTDWDNPANWIGCGSTIPGTSDDVIIPSTGVTHEPIMNTDAQINHLSIATGRTLSTAFYQTLTINGNLQNNGTIDISGSTISSIEFAGSSTQSISGDGIFTGIGEMVIQTGRNITLANPITLAIDTFKNYGTLNLGSHSLTISNTVFENGSSIYGPGIVSGSGNFQTQGSSEIDNYDNSNFEVALQVMNDTTTASGTLDGGIVVDAGATLNAGTYQLIANNDVTIDGTLSGADTYSDFHFGGQTFTNNGTVSVMEFISLGASSTLTGTSHTMNNTNLVVETGTLGLGSDLSVSSVEIKAHATFDITDRQLTLLGSGFFSPLYIYPDGSFVATSSTVIYGSDDEQEITALDYYNLSSTGSGARILNYGTTGIAGEFSPGNNTYTINYSTIEYNGTAYQILPAGFDTYANLIISNPNGVTLSGDVTVNEALTLNADLFTDSYTLILGDTYTRVEGNYEVVGAVRRTEFETYYAGGFNSPNTLLSFHNGTLPGEATVTVERQAPTGPGLLPAVARIYNITQTGGSGFVTDIRLHYLDNELGNIQEGNLQLWRWDGSRWLPQGRSNINTSQNWVELDNSNQVSGQWAIALRFEIFLPSVLK